jgi:serine/threonine-protein kinase
MSTPRTFGRYELRGILGEGGFAIVYRALDPSLDREVALKVLRPHLAADPEVRRRFLAEARAIARLRHPNIAIVYEVGEAGGRPFFSMELIEGRTLAQMVSPGQGLPLPQVAHIVAGLASAVDYLHEQGLVHRDIKAANAMVDRFGRVVLMDFGIARALDRTQHTRAGAILGTLETMSPEQVRGQPAGPPADIYALGIVTYQMLAGRPPFEGDTAYMLYAHAHEAPPPLRTVRSDLPEPVYGTLELAFAKDPAQRPHSAQRLADALVASPTPRPQTTPRPLAPPPRTQVRSRRTSTDPGGTRHSKLPAFAIAGAAFMIAGVVIVSLLLPSRSTGAGVSFIENFDSPNIGTLPKKGYIGGQFSISRNDPSTKYLSYTLIPGEYSNLSIAVDVRAMAGTPGQYVAIACRENSGRSANGYRFSIVPDTQEYNLSKWDNNQYTVLSSGVTPAIRGAAETNHLELYCVGSTIYSSVNGTEVTRVNDREHQKGRLLLGVGLQGGRPGPAEALFDNLVVTKR